MGKWSLNAKIYSIVVIFVFACAIISYVGISKMNGINDALNRIVDGPAKKITLSGDLKASFLTMSMDEKNFILEESKSEMEKIGERIVKTEGGFNKSWDEYFKIADMEGKKDLQILKNAFQDWMVNNKEIQKLSLAGENKAAFKSSTTTGRALRIKAQDLINERIEDNKKKMELSSAETDSSYAHARLLMIWISIIAVLAGLLTSYLIMKSVNRSIDEVISDLTDNSNQVTSAAHQIASSSEELSQASTEQASALEETSCSIEELNSMVQKNADNAKKTSDIAGNSKNSAGKGKEKVHDMINAIDDINISNQSIMESINDSNKRISEIVDVISEIGNKTKVINEIVFQTKLLSFNASVEAARAGEHGKGFAVVAEEVGNLAQMSGNAAKDITAMLEGSILKVQGIVSDTKARVEHLIIDGKEKVETGTRIANECGLVLDEIVTNITTVNQMADEISVACQEQAQGVQEITRAIGQLDQVTQINNTTSSETAGAAEELSVQAESLRNVVGILVQTIKGGANSNVTHQRLHVTSRAPTSKKSSNVVSLKAVKAKTTEFGSTLKKAVGQNYTPIDNDPRFEEV